MVLKTIHRKNLSETCSRGRKTHSLETSQPRLSRIEDFKILARLFLTTITSLFEKTRCFPKVFRHALAVLVHHAEIVASQLTVPKTNRNPFLWVFVRNPHKPNVRISDVSNILPGQIPNVSGNSIGTLYASSFSS